MTTATVWKKETINRIYVNGHADYSTYGSDIVCSSISTATILTANLISKLTDDYEIVFDEENAIIDIKITDCNSSVINTIMESLYETLCDISNQYPKNLTIKLKNC